MQVGQVAFVHAAAQGVGVGGEADAVFLDDVAGTAHRRGTIVAVLGYLVARTCHHKAGAGGDVECILAVASGTHNVDGTIGREVHGYTCLHQCFAEAGQLVYSDVAHAEGCQQGGHLRFGIAAVGNVEQQLSGFGLAEVLVIEES